MNIVDLLQPLWPLPNIASRMVLAILLGLCAGSFISMLSYRLAHMLLQQNLQLRALASPASHCPNCHKQLAWHDLIPLFGYLLQVGRCRYCQQPISWRYPLIELIAVAISLFCLLEFDSLSQAVLISVFLLSLLCLTVIDLEYGLLPDLLTLPLLWLALIGNSWIGLCSLQDAVIGASGGYLLLFLTFHSYRLLTGKIAMGHGDFKLLAAIGAWLGWGAIDALILTSATICLLWHGTNPSQATKIPFGPYLSLAAWLWLIHRALL